MVDQDVRERCRDDETPWPNEQYSPADVRVCERDATEREKVRRRATAERSGT
jgi:hypothetical protein